MTNLLLERGLKVEKPTLHSAVRQLVMACLPDLSPAELGAILALRERLSPDAELTDLPDEVLGEMFPGEGPGAIQDT